MECLKDATHNLYQIHSSNDNVLLPQLKLIEGINNDVAISSIITGGHMFVQQPVHPTYPGLQILHRCMNNNYNKCDALPLLDNQIAKDVVCAAKVNDFWYRVQIGHHETRNKQCVVKFLDYGGYTTVNTEDLRQIRADFMTIPFQAIECVLSNVRPIEGTAIVDLFSFKVFVICLFVVRQRGAMGDRCSRRIGSVDVRQNVVGTSIWLHG